MIYGFVYGGRGGGAKIQYYMSDSAHIGIFRGEIWHFLLSLGHKHAIYTLNYGNNFWGRVSSTALNLSFILQKKVTRILTR